MTPRASGVVAVSRALRASLRFVYRHGFSFVLVSFAWALASLPLVTVGPATLGAYAAVGSLREKGWVDRREVLATVRSGAVHAVLLTLVEATFGVMAVLYLAQFLASGSTLAGVLAVGAAYAAAHLALALPATFLGLARGVPLDDALRAGYRWTVEEPLTAALMGGWTLALFVVSAGLTIAVVLVFPAIAFTFHAVLLDDVTGRDGDGATPPAGAVGASAGPDVEAGVGHAPAETNDDGGPS